MHRQARRFFEVLSVNLIIIAFHVVQQNLQTAVGHTHNFLYFLPVITWQFKRKGIAFSVRIKRKS